MQPNIKLPKKPEFLMYWALLYQTGTSAPTSIILLNTFNDTPVWSYINPGEYQITLNNAFTLDKTGVLLSPTSGITGIGYNLDPNYLIIYTKDASDTPQNDYLYSTLIQIIVKS